MQSTMLTLGQAAKATGKSKTTIAKAIKEGRITGRKKKNGEYEIEPSELFRVYQAVKVDPSNTEGSTKDKDYTKELEIRLSFMKERLTDKDSQIDYLKEQCAKWDEKATLLIEDMRSADERAKEEKYEQHTKLTHEMETMRERLQRELEEYEAKLQKQGDALQQRETELSMIKSSRLGRWILKRSRKRSRASTRTSQQ